MTPDARGGTVWIIGAGLAGLSAAVRLAGEGRKVTVLEAANQAGGRCRSYLDPQLGMTIDNGNHLVLSGNHATFDYLRAIGAEDRMAGPDEASFSFCDVRDGRRWTVRPNAGPLAWWVLSKARRVPDTRAADYLGLIPLMAPGGGKRIDEVLPCTGALWERLLEPFLLAALNTDPRTGSLALASAVMRETLLLGGDAYRPRIAEPSLAAAFVEPALAWLAANGGAVRLGQRVQGLGFDGDRLSALRVAGTEIPLAADDRVILATPPWIAAELVPELTVPDAFESIVNAHYRIEPPPGAAPMVGVIGGAAQWVFALPGRLSVTVSAADALVDRAREDLARLLWRDVAAVHDLGPEPPPWQIVKEKRATFAATPEQAARRPKAHTRWTNLALAGDWTDTGLPATIEGAIRSGHAAARLMAKSPQGRH